MPDGFPHLVLQPGWYSQQGFYATLSLRGTLVVCVLGGEELTAGSLLWMIMRANWICSMLWGPAVLHGTWCLCLGKMARRTALGIPKKAIFVSCDVQEDIRHVNKNHKNVYFKNCNWWLKHFITYRIKTPLNGLNDQYLSFLSVFWYLTFFLPLDL